MLYEISRELGIKLTGRKVPVPVSYGPERTESTTPVRDERIVFDDGAGDELQPARHGPKGMRMISAEAAVIRIFAQATSSGAAIQDHRRRARAIRDQVLVALDDICRVARRTVWRVASMKFLSADELELQGIATWSGAVYELRFSVDRAVMDRDFTGAGAATTTVASVTTTSKVSLANGPDDDDDPTNIPANAETV